MDIGKSTPQKQDNQHLSNAEIHNQKPKKLDSSFGKSLESDLLKEQATSVKAIYQKRLPDFMSPQEFLNKFNGAQRDRILRDQICKKVPNSELKPYLLADQTYLIHHFKNKDLNDEISDEIGPSQSSIPSNYYYDFEEIEKTLRFSVKGLDSDQTIFLLKSIDPEVLKTSKTLDLNGCYALENLAFVNSFQFDHLHEINCSHMGGLISLEGLPKHHNFREIDLTYCFKLKDLSPLEGVLIKKLNLTDCAKIADLTPLLNVKNLEILNLSGCMAARPTPENIAALQKLYQQGVKIHAEKNTLLAWRHHKNLFEETKQVDTSTHIKV